MSKLKLFLLLAVALMAGRVDAAQLSEMQLRAAATHVLKAKRPVQRVATYKNLAVYNQQGGGFAIVAVRDNAPAVVAYSSEGAFDASTPNPGFLQLVAACRQEGKPEGDH